MKKLGAFVKNILLITIPSIVVILLILELFFRVVVPATDSPGGYFDEKEKIYKMSNKKETGLCTIGRFAELRAKWRINNEGWNYPIDYEMLPEEKLIAVIGDSYIEAFQVDADKNYPYLMRERLYPDYEVYAFGKSGYPLSQYLHISRYVRQHYDADVLIFNLVHNDFAESVKHLHPSGSYFLQLSIDPENDEISETIPRPNYSFRQYKPTKSLIYKSSIFRYLWGNLKVNGIVRRIRKKNPDTQHEENIDVKETQSNKEVIWKATDYLIRTIDKENADKRVIFVFDAPRNAIYNDDLDESNVLWLHEMVEKICIEVGVEFVDLTRHMEQDYKVKRKKFNSELDGHWNEYGHQLVADVLLDYLNNNEDKER